jgi:tetratricopeptide (TPR) repeat protein
LSLAYKTISGKGEKVEENSSRDSRPPAGVTGKPKWTAIIIFPILVVAVIAVLYILGPGPSGLLSSPQSPISPPPSATVANTQKLDEANFINLYEAGLKDYDAGDYIRAVEVYSAALTLQPNSPDVFNARGNAYLAMGKTESALQDYDKAVELNSSFAEAYYNRGRARTETGDYEAALSDFSRVAATDPRLAYSAIVNRGVVYFKMGDYDRAVKEYDAAINTDPNQALAYLNKATALMELKNFASAVANYKRAHEIDGRLGAAFWGEGWADYNLNDYDASIAATQKAISLIPNNAALYFNLGLAQLAANHIKEANASYQTGLPFASADEKKQAITELEALKETMPERAADVDQLVKSLR